MEINHDKCTKCGLCSQICRRQAVDYQTGMIDSSACNVCSHCLAICPAGAISHAGMLMELPAAICSAESFSGLVQMRRTHRKFRDEPISAELIGQITELMRHVPTGSNTQAVWITVVTDRAILQSLRDTIMVGFRKVHRLALNPLILPFARWFAGSRKIRILREYTGTINQYFKGEDNLTWNAPALFIFHAPVMSSTPEQDCVIWATTGMLYAESLGLGTCFNGVIVNRMNASRQASRLVRIPPDHQVYSAFVAGHPARKFQRPAAREKAKVAVI